MPGYQKRGKKHEDLSNAGPSDAILISSESDPIGKKPQGVQKSRGAAEKKQKMVSLEPSYDMDEKSLSDKARLIEDMAVFFES